MPAIWGVHITFLGVQAAAGAVSAGPSGALAVGVVGLVCIVFLTIRYDIIPKSKRK